MPSITPRILERFSTQHPGIAHFLIFLFFLLQHILRSVTITIRVSDKIRELSQWGISDSDSNLVTVKNSGFNMEFTFGHIQLLKLLLLRTCHGWAREGFQIQILLGHIQDPAQVVASGDLSVVTVGLHKGFWVFFRFKFFSRLQLKLSRLGAETLALVGGKSSPPSTTTADNCCKLNCHCLYLYLPLSVFVFVFVCICICIGHYLYLYSYFVSCVLCLCFILCCLNTSFVLYISM